VAVPNARIALNLLRCVRRLPGALDQHNYDDIGAALAPAFARLPKDLGSAFKAHLAATRSVDSNLSEEDIRKPDLLVNRYALTLLGEAASKQLSCFKTLLDSTEALLESFIDKHPHPADHNLEMLAEMLSLPVPEQAYLRLAAAFCYGTLGRRLFCFVDTGAKFYRALEAICASAPAARLRMFDANSPLAKSGLLGYLRGKPGDLDDMLELSPAGNRLLSSPFESPEAMSRAVLDALPPPSEGQSLEWPHLAETRSVLVAALRQAIASSTPGLNVLLHGGPGTGKTEFVRHLLRDAGLAGFQVGHTSDRGEEASRSDRLASLKLSQTFASRHDGAVLVLDEAEDVFTRDYQSPFARLFKQESESKAWINQMLENNPHPVIWISNQVQHLDPAYLRRFSLCVEFPRMPLAQRQRLAEAQLAPLGCTAAMVERVAGSDAMTPALVASAARLARLSAGADVAPDAAVRVVLEGHCSATGQALPRDVARSLTRFDARYLNLSGGCTPNELVDAMREDGCANLLFYGSPGTGKTQFAAQIAERLGRRLVVRTASDLNSKWYGESEGNVARMFKECDARGELLFLDEADVLLGAREHSTSRADRAVTAEFLRWLETFGGLFICATNHAGDFDSALMRRFAYRVGFEPLKLEQRLDLLSEMTAGWQPDLNSPRPELAAADATRLARLDKLTPGDFANVARRMKRREPKVESWLTELESEQAAKGRPHSRIGFV
jgi:SpoVK/Ycf46/Vps4 family AAA+-type ATPase